jgi:hypothetical protein
MDTRNLAILGWLVAILGVVLTYTLARHGKRQDFRFEILQEAASVYQRIVFHIGTLRSALAIAKNPQVAESAGIDLRSIEDPFITGNKLRSIEAEAIAIAGVMEHLFSKKTHSRWMVLLDSLNTIGKHVWEKQEVDSVMVEVHGLWSSFGREAARECGLRRYGYIIEGVTYYLTANGGHPEGRGDAPKRRSDGN